MRCIVVSDRGKLRGDSMLHHSWVNCLSLLDPFGSLKVLWALHGVGTGIGVVVAFLTKPSQ